MSIERTAPRTQFNPVERAVRQSDGRTRVEISGLWTASLGSYVRDRVAPDAEVSVERRGERVFVVVEE